MDGRHHLRPLSSHYTTKTVIFFPSNLKCATLSAVEVLLHLLPTRIEIMGRLPFRDRIQLWIHKHWAVNTCRPNNQRIRDDILWCYSNMSRKGMGETQVLLNLKQCWGCEDGLLFIGHRFFFIQEGSAVVLSLTLALHLSPPLLVLLRRTRLNAALWSFKCRN